MNSNLIFVPVLIQVLLSLFVFIRLGQVKEQAVKRGEVDQTRRALHDDAWPDYVLKVNNSIRNQFETPILFYVLVFSLWSLNAATVTALLLALLYALLRLAHAAVHLGSNIVKIRKRVFQASIVTLILLSGLLFLALLGAPV